MPTKIIPQPPNNQTTQLAFPKEGDLPRAAWNLWHKAVKNTICDSQGYLKTPLGKWIHNYKKWTPYYDPTINTAHTTGHVSVLPKTHKFSPITDLETVQQMQVISGTYEPTMTIQPCYTSKKSLNISRALRFTSPVGKNSLVQRKRTTHKQIITKRAHTAR
eukprot:5862551-Ditylum_brightwellii.AAC.1